MPLPTPNKNESQDKFIQRCMGNDTMLNEYPDEKQRSAVCYSKWNNKGKKSKKKETSITDRAREVLAELKGLLGYWNDRDKEKEK